jgi:hypothetical protein
MQDRRRLFGLIALISVSLVRTSFVCAQSPTAATTIASATLTINFGGDQLVAATIQQGISDLVGLQPNQVVDVTVQLPAKRAGRTIIVHPLDGGRVIGATNKLVVEADGTISFRFQASGQAGTSQVSLRDGGRELGLQFWVFDLLNPQNNPPAITPATPFPSS